jgi:hypothetical protein
MWTRDVSLSLRMSDMYLMTIATEGCMLKCSYYKVLSTNVLKISWESLLAKGGPVTRTMGLHLSWLLFEAGVGLFPIPRTKICRSVRKRAGNSCI